MDYKEFSQELKKEFEAFKPPQTPVQFNVLDEMHANENAHSRILARLLQEKPVCRSFFEYLSEIVGRDLVHQGGEKDVDFSVTCCSEYIDVRVEYGKNVIIIENKVNDAIDQDKQIDRYVRKEMTRHQPDEIYVVYLTRDGEKKVSSYSFSDTKDVLGFKSDEDHGRFIALNYKHHIVEWLSRRLTFSIEDLETQHYLRSGIQQYLHYLHGPELLNDRKDEDPYAQLRHKVSKRIKDVANMDLAIDALSELYKEALRDVLPRGMALVDILKDEIRKAVGEGVYEIKYWDKFSCDGWGEVDHGYWWRPSGFALQLSENFTGEHVVRSLELFPRRGIDFTDAHRVFLEQMHSEHPYFPYWWNGRTVYKFPVSNVEEAKELGGKLAKVFVPRSEIHGVTAD